MEILVAPTTSRVGVSRNWRKFLIYHRRPAMRLLELVVCVWANEAHN